jgi:hypothetical protein
VEATRYLLVQRRDIGRQQSVKVERLASLSENAVPLLNCGSASNSYPLSAVVAKAEGVSDMISSFQCGMPGGIASLRCKGSEANLAYFADGARSAPFN